MWYILPVDGTKARLVGYCYLVNSRILKIMHGYKGFSMYLKNHIQNDFSSLINDYYETFIKKHSKKQVDFS